MRQWIPRSCIVWIGTAAWWLFGAHAARAEFVALEPVAKQAAVLIAPEVSGQTVVVAVRRGRESLDWAVHEALCLELVVALNDAGIDAVRSEWDHRVESTVDLWAAQQGLTVVCTGEPVWRSWLVRLP